MTQVVNQPEYKRSWKDKFNLIFSFIHFSVMCMAIIYVYSNLVGSLITLFFALLLLGLMIQMYLKKNPYLRYSELPLFLCAVISIISIFLVLRFFTSSYYLLFFLVLFTVLEFSYLVFYIYGVFSLSQEIARFHSYDYGNSILSDNKKYALFDKGRQFWKDLSPEALEEKKKQLELFKKKYKRKLILILNIIGVFGYLFGIIFGFSLLSI